jgi:hypothetical protein
VLTSEDLYESMYWRELDLRDKLDSRLQLPLTLGTSIVAALSFLLSNVDTKHSWALADIVFVVLLGLTFLSLAAGAVFFFKASVGSFSGRNIYLILPTAEELHAFETDWKTYKRENVIKSGGKSADTEVRRSLIRRYIRCQKKNAEINDFRAVNISRLQRSIVVTTMIGGITFATFFFGGLSKANHPAPQDVRIVNLSELESSLGRPGCALSRMSVPWHDAKVPSK